ncbi:MAG: acyltransferase family protein [Acidobacteriia bacterium]|nr:acyltransferase family protein [Terriglobia bacterium]
MAQASVIPPARAVAPARLAFIDNLRWLMIVLVITMHAAVTYSNMGRWYYNEKAQLDLGSRLFFTTYQVWLQAFFMGFLFFIAGYFVPSAFDRKGSVRFLRDRAVRLGIPSLVYMLVIGPATIYYLLVTKQPGYSFAAFWAHYTIGPSIRQGGTGPMWFCVALLIFCAAYAAVRVIASPSAGREEWLPGNRHVVLFIMAIATATFLVRTVQPIGTAIWNMQLCFFSQYVLLFIAGLHACRHGWLLLIPHRFGMRWLGLSLGGGAVAWFALLITAVRMHWETKSFDGGSHWQSAVLCAWESFFCVGVCLGLIVVFREGFNAQGRSARFLSGNAFAVYVFHPPVVIAAALALRGFHAPPVAKFAVVSAIAAVVTFGVAPALRSVPVLKRVL